MNISKALANADTQFELQLAGMEAMCENEKQKEVFKAMKSAVVLYKQYLLANINGG